MIRNRVRGGDGLDHPTRRRIYRHLLMLPGDHFRSIARVLKLGHGTVIHHIEVLTHAGLIASENANGRVRYYPKGVDSELERNQLFTKHWNYRDLRIRILFVLRRNGGGRPGEIARHLGVSRQLVGYHLARLKEMGLVDRENGRYWARPPGESPVR
jgi:predicted transcriptional regulator